MAIALLSGACCTARSGPTAGTSSGRTHPSESLAGRGGAGETGQSRRCRCSRNVGGPQPAGCTSVARARIGFGWTATASGALVGPTGAATCDADATAGPLVTAVTPQQLRADGSDSGSGQCPQQLSARSSAASTQGFV